MLRTFCRHAINQKFWKTSCFMSGTKSFSTQEPPQSDLTEGEKKLQEILLRKFPQATTVEVSDISGGCGAMYEVCIEAEEFRGQKTIKQHRMVNEALSEEIKMMHGLKINTAVPRS